MEHLIKNLNPEVITEDISNRTVQKLIECGLITKNGFLSKIFLEKNQKQDIKINININFNININTSNNKKITNLNDFYIDNINDDEIPKVSASFYDLAKIYKKKNYNYLSKDYSLYINNNFKDFANKLLEFKNDNFLNFYKILLKFVKMEIGNLLRKKYFRKYKGKSMIEAISANLSQEERKGLSEIMGEARKEILEKFKN